MFSTTVLVMAGILSPASLASSKQRKSGSANDKSGIYCIWLEWESLAVPMINQVYIVYD
jgi:hypothetical protein